MEEIQINVGSLSSIEMLYYNISPILKEIRKTAMEEKIPPRIIWDFRNIVEKKMNMATLTAFLSIAKSISNYFGKPSPILLRWNPSIIGFLYDISFFKNGLELSIISVPKEMIGGFTPHTTNPNTKIVYYNEVPTIFDDKDSISVNQWKKKNRERISKSLIVSLGNIFSNNIFEKVWNDRFKYVLSNVAAELAINSLLHGQETVFIGIQRSSVGISVSVCDSGIGFLNSMKTSNKWIKKIDKTTNIKCLVYASLWKEYDIGLKLVIDEITKNGGWVKMSSFDSEVKWEQKNWTSAKKIFDRENFQIGKQEVNDILGPPEHAFFFQGKEKNGYYVIYPNSIRGSRIAFEIPFK
ncbi:MAG: hypothetical protein ABIY50_10720 [Ignavibacteria bacterium]